MTAVLGITALCHDSAAALVVDGEVVAAAQEERFSRKKHDDALPVGAIEFCLRSAGIDASQLDVVGFSDKPLLELDRLLETCLAHAPAGYGSFLASMPLWLKQKLHLPRAMRSALGGAYRKRFLFAEHHESHAASAFFPSPFDEAAILTLDGVGEWATASIGVGRGNRIELLREQRYPHSIGLLYAAFTAYCGFPVNDGEHELMGLAPLGEPRFAGTIRERLMDLKADGSLRLDLRYLDFAQRSAMTSRRFHELFGGPPRTPEQPLSQRHRDLAASIQQVTEDVVLRSARCAHQLTGQRDLCLGGGVALNCVANGRLLREGPFERIWVQPAAGDAGTALGVALLTWFQLLDHPRAPRGGDLLRGSLLGSVHDDEEIRCVLEASGLSFEHVASDAALCEQVAADIDAGSAVGWFQGAMEFGPRALGTRSILGDPRRADMLREGIGPFAPAVLAEHAGGLDRVKLPRSEVVTHVDRERNPLFRRLLEAFHRRTGCPLVVGASFNLAWEPIVRTPFDALETFMSCDLDVLCIGHFLVRKASQPASVPAVSPEQPDAVLAPLLVSPVGGATLHFEGDRARCTASGTTFERADGIWQLFWPHEGIDDARDVTRTVQAFYEETPFPSYDELDSVRALIEKSRAGIYAAALSRAIKPNSTVLEVGCGTGQLTNFLGSSCRRVIGTDLCLASLRLGEGFRRAHGLERVRFVQMNLFRPCFAEEQFDVVLCNGVLHHTADPFGGYASLVPLVKPGGYLVIGLYNRWARLMTDLRRVAFRMTGGRARWIDPMLRRVLRGESKRRAWFADQYRHPHESKHTIGEVLGWFERTGIEPVRGVPSLTPVHDPIAELDLFEPRPRGSALEHAVVQASQVLGSSQKEGGLFIMIGRKPARAEADSGAPARAAG